MTKEVLAVTAIFLVTTFAQYVPVWGKGQRMVKFKIHDLFLLPTPFGVLVRTQHC
jgi:hypothetical protein